MRKLSKIIFLLLLSISVFAQGVCDIKTGVEKGGFTFDGPFTVCIGQEIKLKDNSGGTEIKYIFGYQGDDASKLSSISSTTTPKWTFLAPGQYTVLQYGKKNGKEMYYCDVVKVRENNQPKFTYNSCGDNFLTIIIPKDVANDFDYYEIDWGDGKLVEKVINLPFNNYRNYSTSTPTRNIRVEGFYNLASNCPRVSQQTVQMRQGGNYVSISQVQLTDDQKEAIITLKGADAEYDFYQRGRNSDYNLSTPFIKTLPGIFKVKLIDTVQTCFTAVRNSGCTEIAGEVCTVRIENITVSGKDNVIKWEPHALNLINNVIGVDAIVNSTTTTLIKQEQNQALVRVPLISSPPYFDKVDCSKEYCYQIEVKVGGNLRNLNNFSYTGISLSPKRCINRKEVTPDAITASIVTVKDNNLVDILITDNSPWTLNRKEYLFYRMNGNDTTRIQSGSLTKQFTDISVDASEKSICYKVGFVDECKSKSALSPLLCTINLTEPIANNLQWTNQSSFGSSAISKFEVQSYNEQTNIPSTEVTKNATETTYQPILDNFEEEAKYRIRTVSIDGKESFSNIYTIPIAIKLFLPDAFTPNNDNINDNLEIKGSTKRITAFEIQVYNRWGNPVFTSNSPSETWDGTYQNNIVPSDTYSYKIYAKLNDGKELNKSGKFLLLR